MARSTRPSGIALCVVVPAQLRRTRRGMRVAPSEPAPAPLASVVVEEE